MSGHFWLGMAIIFVSGVLNGSFPAPMKYSRRWQWALNPRRHQSGTSIDRATRISKIGNAVLRAALYMPAMSVMRFNPAIVALVTRLKSRGRLKPKQIVVAAMRKLLVLCFGVLKTGKPFDPAIATGC